MFGLFTRSTRNPAVRCRGVDQHGCFGKMPIHPDFIRHGVRAREVVAFENWVQEGVGLVSRQSQGDERNPLTSFPRHHLVMTGGEQERTLGATLTASRDRSGRAYPFVLFRLADEPLLIEMQAAAPLVFEEFYQCSNEILDAPWRQEPLALLLDRIDGMTS
ncbi:MAG TPA: type VI secretion system-associated protein TagF, partial [Geoalkalibacter subterraneus]|nr:type VI secretion system-associated protein TagF [Geoalkalibacter subterraneus]